MHPISNSKENDLVTLKNFCQYEKLGGTHTMLWFYGLISRYPLEYLLYSRDTPFHNHYRDKAKERLKLQAEIFKKENKCLITSNLKY
jgi:hypothetical protein